MIKGVRTLKYGEIINVIGEIFREGETGTLLLQNEPAAKYLYFQGGQIIFAASNAPEDKFTQILLEEGKLKEEQLDMAMQKKGGKTIAKTLTELGFISSQDLLSSLISQVYRVAGSVIHWNEGAASFKPDVLPQGVARLPLSTQRLILDLSMSAENRQWALQIVGGMDKVISINKAEMDVAIGLPLSAEEEKVVRACDGKKTIEEVSGATGTDPFRALKLLIGLHVLGLAHPKRLIESVAGQVSPQASPAEDKHLDLSFLEQALPDRQEQAAPFELAALPQAEPQPETRPAEEPRPEFKVEKIEEKPFEPAKEVVQPPLFQPTFLPAEERRLGEIKEPDEPRVILPPPNPLPKRTPKHLKFFIGLAATVVILTACAAAYFMFFEGNEADNIPPPPPPKAVPKTPAAKPQAPAAAIQNTKKEEPKPETLSGAAAAPPAAVPSPSPAKVETLPVHTIPPPEQKKAETTKPAAPPAKEPEKPAVKEEPASGDPSASMRAGDYPAAASGFRKVYSSKKGGYTIALMIACEKETIEKSYAGAGQSPDFIIFPHNFKGRGCYRVIWGYYQTKGEAEAAFSKLPELFKSSGAKIVSFDSMKP